MGGRQFVLSVAGNAVLAPLRPGYDPS